MLHVGQHVTIPYVPEESERRVARNEALFREANESIERGLWPGDEHPAVRFLCECARVDCGQMLELSLGDYERVRTNPKRFVMVPGHQLPDLETVVEQRSDYVVVEKRSGAGEVAEQLDPRDDA
jgi:hypothetical protein